MKVHAHLPPPLPTTLLPGRASANQGSVARAVAGKLNPLGDGATAAAWQNVAATALPAGSVSALTIQPLSTQRNASTARGSAVSGQGGSSPAALTPPAQQASQAEVDPGDLPYVRGSIVDIRA